MCDIQVIEIHIPRFISFVNVGEDPPNPPPGSGWIGRRQWSACIEHGFISAGQNPIYSKQLARLEKNDIIATFITGHGYVGIGRVLGTSVPIERFIVNGITLKGLSYVKDTLFENAENENSEYLIRVEWIKTVERKNAYWIKNYGLFANPSIQSSLRKQTTTVKFLEESFQVRFLY